MQRKVRERSKTGRRLYCDFNKNKVFPNHPTVQINKLFTKLECSAPGKTLLQRICKFLDQI